MSLRAVTTFLSLALHAGMASFLMVSTGGAALEAGTGDDMFVVEQGLAIEGIAKLGDAATTTQAVEAEPVEMSEARPPMEEIKAQEPIEETPVIQSKDGPEQEVVEEEPKEIVEPQKQQVATIEQTQQLAVEEQQSSGAKKSGGDTSAIKEHQGKMFGKIFKNRVASRRSKVGTVIVSFTINRDGELLSRKVETSSGVSELDDAALAALDKAAPFPPWPADIANPPLAYTVPFKFTVR